jgi:prepilin-type N-terminal cleavage/methylation domain-containing protein
MKRQDEGFTILELLVVVAIISILAAFVVPGLIRAKAAGNEASAIGSLGAVAKAQAMYSKVCGGGGYATSLAVLGVSPPSGDPPFLAADLTGSPTPIKAGYQFTMVPGAGAAPGPADCNGTPTTTTFYATAAPLTFGNSGYRAFAVNHRNTIYQTSTAVPPTEPFGAPAVPIR